MKEQKPTLPTDYPEGTVWFGGPIEWFSITLSFSSDELDPLEIE